MPIVTIAELESVVDAPADCAPVTVRVSESPCVMEDVNVSSRSFSGVRVIQYAGDQPVRVDPSSFAYACPGLYAGDHPVTLGNSRVLSFRQILAADLGIVADAPETVPAECGPGRPEEEAVAPEPRDPRWEVCVPVDPENMPGPQMDPPVVPVGLVTPNGFAVHTCAPPAVSAGFFDLFLRSLPVNRPGSVALESRVSRGARFVLLNEGDELPPYGRESWRELSRARRAALDLRMAVASAWDGMSAGARESCRLFFPGPERWECVLDPPVLVDTEVDGALYSWLMSNRESVEAALASGAIPIEHLSLCGYNHAYPDEDYVWSLMAEWRGVDAVESVSCRVGDAARTSVMYGPVAFARRSTPLADLVREAGGSSWVAAQAEAMFIQGAAEGSTLPVVGRDMTPYLDGTEVGMCWRGMLPGRYNLVIGLIAMRDGAEREIAVLTRPGHVIGFRFLPFRGAAGRAVNLTEAWAWAMDTIKSVSALVSSLLSTGNLGTIRDLAGRWR